MSTLDSLVSINILSKSSIVLVTSIATISVRGNIHSRIFTLEKSRAFCKILTSTSKFL